MAPHPPVSTKPTELVPGRLFRLGGLAEIGDGISWVAKGVTGYEPINCYLLLEEGGALLVDTGVPLHKQTVAAQLDGLIGRERATQIFLTRFEADCLGNMPTLTADFRISAVNGGGNLNPFDFFDDLSTDEQLRHDYQVEKVRIHPGGAVEVAPGRTVELVVTPLRLLTTFWGYDAATKTLFTSDSFGHAQVATASTTPVIDSSNDTITLDQVREHLLTKFEWLRGAETEPLIEEVDRIFQSHPIDIIAPTTGSVLMGRDVVERHIAMVMTVLGEIKN